MFVCFFGLKGHSQYMAGEESWIFKANHFSLTVVNNEALDLNFRPTNNDLTNVDKFWKASANVLVFNLTIQTILFLSPESFTNWDKEEKYRIKSILSQYKESFTKPPVLDEDGWLVNYVGHPWQGSFYYNSLRSQEASFWSSSFFCIGNTLLWEYVWEGGFEQPSIQDLIVTPVAGILLGELIHLATINMSKNGFRWYEIFFVSLLNTAYAINNSFVFNPKDKNHTIGVHY